MSLNLKSVVLAILVSIPLSSKAHQEMWSYIDTGNIHVFYRLELYGEMKSKLTTAVSLIHKLLSTKSNGRIPLHINFYIDGPRPFTTYYGYSYGGFSYRFRDNETNDNVRYKYSGLPQKQLRGIRIFIRDGDIDIKKWLKLVNCAYDMDTAMILSKQINYKAASQYGYVYHVTSIPIEMIKSCMSHPDEVTAKTMKDRVYRNGRKEDSGRYKFDSSPDRQWQLDYYYQDGLYHFYSTSSRYSEEKDMIVPDEGYGRDLLITNRLLEIQGAAGDGYLAFVDDTTFYFFESSSSIAKGPFIIPGYLKDGRPPISKWVREYNPSRFTLFLGTYGEYGKVLFIVDSNLVIPHYDSLEAKLFSSLKQHNRRPDKVKVAGKQWVGGIICLIIGLVVGIYLGLLLNRFR